MSTIGSKSDVRLSAQDLKTASRPLGPTSCGGGGDARPERDARVPHDKLAPTHAVILLFYNKIDLLQFV